jgi:hypothetical protein
MKTFNAKMFDQLVLNTADLKICYDTITDWTFAIDMLLENEQEYA